MERLIHNVLKPVHIITHHSNRSRYLIRKLDDNDNDDILASKIDTLDGRSAMAAGSSTRGNSTIIL